MRLGRVYLVLVEFILATDISYFVVLCLGL